MKIIKIIPLSISVAALAFASSSWAAGTLSGTEIDNTAILSYNIGTVAQTVIESSVTGNSTPGAGLGTATKFIVDKKIDLLVTSGSVVNVTPGATAQNITFTLKNEGNSSEDFSFTSPSQVAGDSFDTTNCLTPATVVALAPDATAIITVVCDIPASGGTILNNATSIIDLKATAVGVSQTSGADTVGIDTVFADSTGTPTDGADRNASHSATNTYTVNTADLKISKTSAVTKMSINGANVTADAKRIPGSTIVYTITVLNATGAATATGIIINDAVPANLTVVGTPTITGGTSSTASAASNAVTTVPFDLAAGQTATLTITATVN